SSSPNPAFKSEPSSSNIQVPTLWSQTLVPMSKSPALTTSKWPALSRPRKLVFRCSKPQGASASKSRPASTSKSK
ncbi:hypothetical protein BGX30_007844, partial [Mortierella sp. GBA39]